MKVSFNRSAGTDSISAIIANLREKVKRRRVKLAKTLNKDKEVIAAALADPKVGCPQSSEA